MRNESEANRKFVYQWVCNNTLHSYEQPLFNNECVVCHVLYIEEISSKTNVIVQFLFTFTLHLIIFLNSFNYLFIHLFICSQGENGLKFVNEKMSSDTEKLLGLSSSSLVIFVGEETQQKFRLSFLLLVLLLLLLGLLFIVY